MLLCFQAHSSLHTFWFHFFSSFFFLLGPDPNRIYDIDGYTRYLPGKFPKLDYIDHCYIVDEVGIGEDYSDGEF